jgi:hypothetical protein
MPEEPETFQYAGLDLIEEIKRRKEEEQKRLEEQQPMKPQPQRRLGDVRQQVRQGEQPAGQPAAVPARTVSDSTAAKE